MIHIDYQDKRPIYEQVVEKIQNLIVKGVFAEDMKLPSVRNLAVELSINPNTIQRAYGELESNGFIYTVKGRGNFVSARDKYMDNEKKIAMGHVEKAAKQAKQLGISKTELETLIDMTYEEEGE
ncbi:MAG: GntR family transcriptional regulator [Lachnospiraceae bacterium]|nr:GntR family transcriptional regulator [Lachnospiraceae bacterium]